MKVDALQSTSLQPASPRPCGNDCHAGRGGLAEVMLIPRLEGIRRLGVSVSTFEDWSNPKSRRFKPELPRLHSWPGNSRTKCFRSDELTGFILQLTAGK